VADKPEETCAVFVGKRRVGDAGQCWCHGKADVRPPGSPIICIVSYDAKQVIEFCPEFFLDMMQQSLGIHLGAVKHLIEDWPLVKEKLKKPDAEGA
jgi:hypothetical protein